MSAALTDYQQDQLNRLTAILRDYPGHAGGRRGLMIEASVRRYGGWIGGLSDGP